MNELLQALTRAANAVANHYEKSSPKVLTDEAAADIARTQIDEATITIRKERKPRTPKAPAPEAPAAPSAAPAPMPEGLDVPPPAAPAPAAAPEEIPEGKSLAALYEAGAKVVERFKNSKPTGFERATKHMTETYKVARMQDLPHAQRLQFIGWLKTELEKAA